MKKKLARNPKPHKVKTSKQSHSSLATFFLYTNKVYESKYTENT